MSAHDTETKYLGLPIVTNRTITFREWTDLITGPEGSMSIILDQFAEVMLVNIFRLDELNNMFVVDFGTWEGE